MTRVFDSGLSKAASTRYKNYNWTTLLIMRLTLCYCIIAGFLFQSCFAQIKDSTKKQKHFTWGVKGAFSLTREINTIALNTNYNQSTTKSHAYGGLVAGAFLDITLDEQCVLTFIYFNLLNVMYQSLYLNLLNRLWSSK